MLPRGIYSPTYGGVCQAASEDYNMGRGVKNDGVGYVGATLWKVQRGCVVQDCGGAARRISQGG
jgi:hypothetical protein